jgi:copper transport protein
MHQIEVVSSVPANGAIVTAAPTEVLILFAEPVVPDQSRLTVLLLDGSEEGRRVDLNDSAVVPEVPELVRVGLPPDLPAGRYAIRWEVVPASDGDLTIGVLVFLLAP